MSGPHSLTRDENEDRKLRGKKTREAQRGSQRTRLLETPAERDFSILVLAQVAHLFYCRPFRIGYTAGLHNSPAC